MPFQMGTGASSPYQIFSDDLSQFQAVCLALDMEYQPLAHNVGAHDTLRLCNSADPSLQYLECLLICRGLQM